MTTLTGVARTSRLVRFSWWHPEWWIYVLASAAWLGLIVLPAPGDGGGHAHHAGMSETGPALGLDLGHEIAAAGLMVLAMMAPLMAPIARFVALAGPWRRRLRSPALFAGSYVAAWILVAVVLALLTSALSATIGAPLALALVTTGALVWQLTAAKRRALRRCGATLPLAPSGRRADRDALVFGFVSARASFVSCGGIMALAAAAHHALPVVGALFLLQVRERADRRYDPRVGGLVISLVGAAILTVSFLLPMP